MGSRSQSLKYVRGRCVEVKPVVPGEASDAGTAEGEEKKEHGGYRRSLRLEVHQQVLARTRNMTKRQVP